jgi:hypothetical protein
MKRWMKSLAITGLMAVIGFGSTRLMAQPANGGPGGGGPGGGRGNMDPAQMRQMMMDRVREQLDVKGDDEWKAIEPRIQKVMDARRDVGFGGPMGGFGRRARPQGGDQAQGGGNNQGNRQRFRGLMGEPGPEAEALQAAIDSKASADDIKAKLAKYREARKEKQAKLEAAREELRKVLSVRQEAVAVLNGLDD